METSREFATELWDIDRPKDFPQNARKWSARAVEKVGTSIREFGWRQPVVVDSDDVIVIGHLRRAAGKSVGETQCPVHVARDLSPAKIRALRLADNRLNQESTWDWDLVLPEFEELKALDFDLKIAGFDWAELHRGTGMDNLYGATKDEKEAGANKLREKWQTERGQIWEFPSNSTPGVIHRMMIGDSLTDMPQLLGDAKPDGICSDPPYDLDAKVVAEICNRSGADRAIMLLGDSQAFVLATIWRFCMLIVFKHRNRLGMNKHLPLRSYTLAVVYTRTDKIKHGFHKPTPGFAGLQEDVAGGCYEGDGDKGSYPMGQQKSSAVFEIMLSGFAWKTVVDPFAGTGASLLACELSGRRWLGMELDPSTAACCLDRAAKFGFSPVLEQLLAKTAESEVVNAL